MEFWSNEINWLLPLVLVVILCSVFFLYMVYKYHAGKNQRDNVLWLAPETAAGKAAVALELSKQKYKASLERPPSLPGDMLGAASHFFRVNVPLAESTSQSITVDTEHGQSEETDKGKQQPSVMHLSTGMCVFHGCCREASLTTEQTCFGTLTELPPIVTAVQLVLNISRPCEGDSNPGFWTVRGIARGKARFSHISGHFNPDSGRIAWVEAVQAVNSPNANRNQTRVFKGELTQLVPQGTGELTGWDTTTWDCSGSMPSSAQEGEILKMLTNLAPVWAMHGSFTTSANTKGVLVAFCRLAPDMNSAKLTSGGLTTHMSEQESIAAVTAGRKSPTEDKHPARKLAQMLLDRVHVSMGRIGE